MRLTRACSWEGDRHYLHGSQMMTSWSIPSQTQPGYFQGTLPGCIIPNKQYSSLSQEANVTSETLFDFHLWKISVCHLRKAPIENPLGKDSASFLPQSQAPPIICSQFLFLSLRLATLLSAGASQRGKHFNSGRSMEDEGRKGWEPRVFTVGCHAPLLPATSSLSSTMPIML